MAVAQEANWQHAASRKPACPCWLLNLMLASGMQGPMLAVSRDRQICFMLHFPYLLSATSMFIHLRNTLERRIPNCFRCYSSTRLSCASAHLHENQFHADCTRHVVIPLHGRAWAQLVGRLPTGFSFSGIQPSWLLHQQGVVVLCCRAVPANQRH